MKLTLIKKKYHRLCMYFIILKTNLKKFDQKSM